MSTIKPPSQTETKTEIAIELSGPAKALEDLKRRIHITKDIRFQASLRLSRRQTFSNYIISLFSLYVIALSLLPNILSLNNQKTQILLSSSIILSVFIILTSLIDGSRNFYHQSDLLHQCARKISTLHYNIRKIDANQSPEEIRNQIDNIQIDYQNALNDCPINHDNVDYYNQVYRNPRLFPVEYINIPSHPKLNGAINYFVRQKFRVVAFVGEYLWMTLHSIAFIGVTWIVYKYVIIASN